MNWLINLAGTLFKRIFEQSNWVHGLGKMKLKLDFDNRTGRRWLWVQPLYIWRTTKRGEEIHDKGYAGRGIRLRKGPGKLF